MAREHKEPWTPGPWRTEGITEFDVTGPDGRWIAFVNSCGAVRTEAAANARLIIQAPAMAALLERVLDVWTFDRGRSEVEVGDIVEDLALALEVERLLARARGEVGR